MTFPSLAINTTTPGAPFTAIANFAIESTFAFKYADEIPTASGSKLYCKRAKEVVVTPIPCL